MRFAVHRPGYAVASPRFHGVPRRDVACRVHVGVAGVAAGRAPEARLALARPPVHVPARRAPLARVRVTGTFSTRPGALSSSRRTSSPQPDREIPRFSPALARTLRPGCPAVPFADRVMFVMFRSSTRITSKRRAMSVDVFSAQSLRRSLSRAFSRATATWPCRAGSIRAWRGRACAGGGAAAPARGRSGRGGEHLAGGQGRADRHAPVDAHRLPVPRAPGPGRGWRRTRRASGPPGPGSPGRTARLRARRGTSGTAPSRPSGSGPGPSSDSGGARPTAAALPGDPEPLIPPGLAPRRAAVRPGEEAGHGPREVPQRLLLHCVAAPGEPRVAPPARRSAAGTAPGSRARNGVPDATRRAARPRGSTRTGRPSSAAAGLAGGVGWSRYWDMRTHYRVPPTFPGR